MVVLVGSYMFLSKVYGFVQKIDMFPAFARATKRDRWCRYASMSVANAWHRREFKIAPSILSADFARLGEEVRGSAFIVFLYWYLLLQLGLALSLEVDKRIEVVIVLVVVWGRDCVIAATCIPPNGVLL